MRATTAKALRNRRSNSRVSLTFAAVAAQATGTPSPVVAMWYLVPRLPRSVGLGPVRSPPRLARTEQLSRIRSGSPRSIATSRACTRCSRLTSAQSARRRRRVEPLAWAGLAARLRQGVPSRRNRRRVASTRTVSAGGCPGPGSRVPSRRSITVAIRSKILRSNAVPLPVAEQPEMGIGAVARTVRRPQPRMDVETASKHCHGSFRLSDRPRVSEHAQRAIESHYAQQKQRQKQQGLGRPIISAKLNDYRIVIAGNRVHWSREWKTFHDFLRDHTPMVFGKDWITDEKQKAEADQHPLVRWAFQSFKDYQQQAVKDGAITSIPITGAMMAFLGLTYNLYLTRHNAILQDILIRRLKD